MSHPEKCAVVACSGIGKPLGSVTREAAYVLCDELRPGKTVLVALSKLALEEPDALDRIRSYPTITIDGCQLNCASKVVTQNGGKIAREVSVVDFYRTHKGPRPDGIAELNDAGKRLARALAEELADTVDALTAEPEEAGRG